MENNDLVIRIDRQGILIKLSGDKEVMKRQWKKAKKLINVYLEINGSEDLAQSRTETETIRPWSDEEEKIVADNLDKKPKQLEELLRKAGYKRTRGAIYQKKKEILEQQEQQKSEIEAGNKAETNFKKGSWDREEEEFVINNYHRKTITELARELNRPYTTVNNRITKLLAEGRLVHKGSTKTRPEHVINELKEKAEAEETETEIEPESSDDNFPDTLIRYLWNHTDWKFYESRSHRIKDIQKLLKSKYGMDTTEEQIEQIVSNF